MTPAIVLLATALGGATPIAENWVGDIADHPVHLRLSQSGSQVTGSYRYDKIGLSIPLTGSLGDKGQITLKESDAKGAVTGTFEGVISALELHGTWKAPNAKKALGFELKRDDEPKLSTNWSGRLGKKLRVQLHLDRDGDKLSGSYFYERVGTDIPLVGRIDPGDAVSLSEGEAAAPTGLWSGKLGLDGSLQGTWTNPKNKKTLAFNLRETRQMLPRADLVSSGPVQVFSQTVEATGPTDDCTRSYSYPTFKGVANPAVQKALNALVLPLGKTVSADDCASCPEEQKGFGVGLNAGSLLSLTISGESYCGGAHPNHGSRGMTFDLKTGKKLALADLFKPNSFPALTALATQQLLKDENATSLDDTGIAEPTIDASTDWALTDKGLDFHWNPYALASYARGDVEIELPYAALKDLALPDGPLAPLVKGR